MPEIQIWYRTYGTAGDEVGQSIKIAPFQDSLYLICGRYNNTVDGYLLKINSSGTLLSSQRFDGGANDHLRSVSEMMNGDIMIAGTKASNSAFSSDNFVARLDPSGQLNMEYYIGRIGQF